MSLKRAYANKTVTTHASAASAGDLDFRHYSAGTLFFPAGFLSATLTIYRRDPTTGNYVSAGRTITVPATLPGYADIPKEEFPAAGLRFVCSNAGDNGKTLGADLKG